MSGDCRNTAQMCAIGPLISVRCQAQIVLYKTFDYCRDVTFLEVLSKTLFVSPLFGLGFIKLVLNPTGITGLQVYLEDSTYR